jgi:uncharacterized protein DUF3376/patatin-like phospholipase
VTAPSRDLYQELRLALVFNGGVSLAVWMGGAAKEIDRFRRAFSTLEPGATAVYRELLDALRTVVVTDVIAGASAGGINGAFLGYVIANQKSLECAGTNAVRDLWQNLGSMQNLLSTEGHPQSVLQTDKVLFAGCADVFEQFTEAKVDLSDDASRWVRLAITATDTRGYQVAAPITDATDAEVSGVDHRLLFRFRKIVEPGQVRLGADLLDAIRAAVPDAANSGWPFPRQHSARNLDVEEAPDAPALLTRAARTTSSFPIAFYPSKLPLNYTDTQTVKEGRGAELTATPALGDVLEAPNAATQLLPTDAPNDQQLARYAIDGGLWDNSPFEAVMHAVEKTPSGRDVRRVLTYLVGTSEPALEEPEAETQPGILKGLVKALATPSDLGFANDLARICADLKQQHGHRNAVLGLLTSDADVFVLAGQLFPAYKKKLGCEDEDAAGGPAVCALASLPAANAEPAAWLATPETWAWGADPVHETVQRARRLLRGLLRAAGAADLPEDDAEALIEAREHLSQLAWVIDEITDHESIDVNSAPVQRILGEAMADFAHVVTGVQGITAKLLADTSALDDTVVAALRATQSVTEGDSAAVIKRALALHIVLDSLSADTQRDIDYAFTAIRPSSHWPDKTPGQPKRPPLAGATFNHFGGFLRESWRLHDWMWGRIDGSQGLVDNLITHDQLKRLAPPGNVDACRALAAKLAALVIPDDSAPDKGYAAKLAAAALGEPQAAFQRDAAVEALTQKYAAAIAAITSKDDPASLAEIRCDVARRFRFTIVSEEAPVVAAACKKEGGSPPPTETLLADPAQAIFDLASDRLGEGPGTVELIDDAERAIANAFSAFHHPTASAIVRTAEKVTELGERAGNVASAAKDYITSHLHL